MRKYTNQQLIESNRYFVKLDIDYERNSAKILFFKPKENNLKEGWLWQALILMIYLKRLPI